MESVGLKLRAARSRLGLSLEQVNATTRISVKSLQAIEDDDLPGIGSPFFYKSFVKQYAGQLKLDYDELVPAIESAVRTLPEPLIPGQGDAPVPSRSTRRARRRNVRWLFSFASLVAVLVGCSALYAFWQNSRMSRMQTITSWASGFKRDVPMESAKPEADPGGHSADPAIASPQQGDLAGNRIELSAIERTWLSVTTDGTPVFEGVLEPDQTKVLEEHDTARVRTGNAGGVSCVFNGKPIGTFGPRGQVRTVVFTKDNYQVLQPAVHMALTRFTISGE